jgi:hypothetical protein
MRAFRRHPRTIAKIGMYIFGAMLLCGVGIGFGGFVIMSIYQAAMIEFWIGLGMVFVAIFVIFWTILGLIFNWVDYKEA